MALGHRPFCSVPALFYRACCAAVFAGLCASCSQDAAARNRPDPADQFPPNKVLSTSDQQVVMGVLNHSAEGHTPRPLLAAPEGFRWSDVPGALSAAAGPCFMGVAEVSSTDEEAKATLVMPDGQEGTAIVTRTATGVAIRASLGVRGNPELEAEYEKLFHAALKRMGQQRRPQT